MTDSKMLLTTNSSPYHCPHFPANGSNPMPANTRVLLHSRLPMCLLHALIQVSKSPWSCLNQLLVFPFSLLQLAQIQSHSNKINITWYTSFGGQPPFTGFYSVKFSSRLCCFCIQALDIHRRFLLSPAVFLDMVELICRFENPCGLVIALLPCVFTLYISITDIDKMSGYYTCHEISGHLPPSFLALENVAGMAAGLAVASISLMQMGSRLTLWVAHEVYTSSWYCQGDVLVASSAQGATTDRWFRTRQRCQFPLIQHSGVKRQLI